MRKQLNVCRTGCVRSEAGMQLGAQVAFFLGACAQLWYKTFAVDSLHGIKMPGTDSQADEYDDYTWHMTLYVWLTDSPLTHSILQGHFWALV